MVAVLKPSVRSVRREAIVDVAQRLIQSKGYEQMSVQDVQDELGVSRGAIYHYFGSKSAMLGAVVDRISELATAAMAAEASRPGLGARDRFERIFSTLAQWKNARQDLLLGFIEVWLSDDNTLVRDRLRQSVRRHMTPLLADILAQGKAEGVFTMSSPEQSATVLVSLIEGLNERASQLYLDRRAGLVSLAEVEGSISGYMEALERIVGVPAGSLDLIDRETLIKWFG